MLIGITGSLCAGKEALCEWFVEKRGFRRIRLRPSSSSSSSSETSPRQEDTSMSVQEVMAMMMNDRNWEQNYVMSPLNKVEDVSLLQKRPFFILLAIDAPLTERYQRFLTKYDPPLCEHPWTEFMRRTDNCPTLLKYAVQLVHNPYTSLDDLYFSLEKQRPALDDSIRCRPSWDDYFMLLADLASHRSNCMKRRVGCILVRDFRVIATGYNGTPRGLPNCNAGGCRRCNDGAANNTLLSECLCLHAEENALLEAGRERISIDATSVYCNTFPCLGCAKKIIQVGVKEVVFRLSYGLDRRVSAILKQAGILIRQHCPSLRLHLENELQDGILN